MAECDPTHPPHLSCDNSSGSAVTCIMGGLCFTVTLQPHGWLAGRYVCPRSSQRFENTCHYKRSCMDLTVSSRSSLNSHEAEGINHVIVKRQFLSQLCRNSQWGHHFRNERSIDGNRVSSRIAERGGIRSVVTGVRAASCFPGVDPRQTEIEKSLENRPKTKKPGSNRKLMVFLRQSQKPSIHVSHIGRVFTIEPQVTRLIL